MRERIKDNNYSFTLNLFNLNKYNQNKTTEFLVIDAYSKVYMQILRCVD